jgi:hypothetical protein
MKDEVLRDPSLSLKFFFFLFPHLVIGRGRKPSRRRELGNFRGGRDERGSSCRSSHQVCKAIE